MTTTAALSGPPPSALVTTPVRPLGAGRTQTGASLVVPGDHGLPRPAVVMTGAPLGDHLRRAGHRPGDLFSRRIDWPGRDAVHLRGPLGDLVLWRKLQVRRLGSSRRSRQAIRVIRMAAMPPRIRTSNAQVLAVCSHSGSGVSLGGSSLLSSVVAAAMA
jgi:hypothetical protein